MASHFNHEDTKVAKDTKYYFEFVIFAIFVSFVVTCGRPRILPAESARYTPRICRAPAPCWCAPGRGCRRPRAAQWSNKGILRARTFRGSVAGLRRRPPR